MNEEDNEFRGVDSRSHLTKHQTGGRYDIIEERSELNSPEEQRLLVYNRIWGNLVHPVFHQVNDHYFSGKIGKDRQSRKENVEVLKNPYYDENKPRHGPLKLERKLRSQQDDTD